VKRTIIAALLALASIAAHAAPGDKWKWNDRPATKDQAAWYETNPHDRFECMAFSADGIAQ